MIFDWVDFYQEYADKLLEYKNNRKPLVEKIKRINELIGFSDVFLWDGKIFEDICPFTAFSIFNRGNISDDKKIYYCKWLRDEFNIKSEVPTDFSSIPVMFATNIRFYEFGNQITVNSLWEVFESAIDYSRNKTEYSRQKFISTFDIAEQQKFVRFNLTMGLYWIRPYTFINLDSTNRQYIKSTIGENIRSTELNGERYLYIVEKVSEYLKRQDDMNNFLDFSYKAWLTSKNKEDNSINRTWLYSPGNNATMWDEFYKDGIMALGWDELGNLSQYPSREKIQDELQKYYNSDASFRNDSLANWEFVHKMNIGDIVYAKKGVKEIIGKGIVESDYIFDDKRESYKSYRRVKWISREIMNHVEEFNSITVQKTLTDITKYQKYVDKINSAYEQGNKLLKEEVGEDMPTNRKYYWLNANPKIWSFSELNIGDTIDYTATNENGNKRRIYKNFVEAKKGDHVICYESYPTQKIVGLGVVDRDLFIDDDDVEVLMIKKVEELLNPIGYKDLTVIPELKNMEYFKNPQGSLFKLTEEEYSVLMDLIRDNNPIKSGKKVEKYTKANFLLDVIMDDPEYDKLVTLLKNKKNLILQGAPGVGKTYIAKRLAYSIMGEKDDERIKFVQFHQSYSYEDFVEGYKPTETSFELEKGVFYNFCKMAEKDADIEPEKPYFFIIDEINRGNISKIFGELLMLIENDKRGEKTNLAYSKAYFSVPKNVYIIGMMNTADRSLALIDYALRRRFAFYDVKPIFDNKEFKKYQAQLNNRMFDSLINKIEMLNEEIINDPSLDEGYVIGHSYFCNHKSIDKNKIDLIINYEILPLLKEYWFDNKDKYEEWKKTLNGVLNG